MCVSSLCDFVYHIRCSSTSHNYERVSVRACVYVEKHLSASVLFQCRAKLNICGLGMEVGGAGVMKEEKEEEKESWCLAAKLGSCNTALLIAHTNTNTHTCINVLSAE